MIQVPFISPIRYIHCPGCGKGEHEVSHLAAGTVTLWFCDECGVRFRLHVIDEDHVDT